MPVRISLARESDCTVIAAMARDLVEYGLEWSWTESRVRYYLRHRDCAVIIAREGRRVAGFAIMQFADFHAHLALLAVHPGCRRRGIGSALVHWLETSARTAGIFEVRLELRADNATARALYEHLGYAPNDIRPAYYGGHEDALRMSHDLTLPQMA